MLAKCPENLQLDEPSNPAEVNAENPNSSFRAVMSLAAASNFAKLLISSTSYPACFNNFLFTIIPYPSYT
jgi:hypothetical protein